MRDNGIGLGDLSPEEAVNPFVTSKEAGRGMAEERLIDGARRGTMDILTEWTVWADKILVF